ncbi:Probable NAD(P)H dehydrogenase (quinone) FQR1-like 2 [Linum grandiflorum]
MGKGGGCFPSKTMPPPIQPSPAPLKLPEQDQQQNETTTKPKIKIFIIFYSMYGAVEALARKVKQGVDSVEGVEGLMYRVPETLSTETLYQMKAKGISNDVPLVRVEEMVDADGFLFGFPTRFGSMAAQMKAFFEGTEEEIWKMQKLAGIPAGLFVCTGTQGGGQETTALTAITQLAHHGMIYVPIGYTFGEEMSRVDDGIRGGSPYGAGVFSGDGTRPPSETELGLAEHQGRYMATLVKRFASS